LLTKFQGLATSGRHNSATITDRWKFTTKLTLYGCLVVIFTVRINSVFPWDGRFVQERYLPKFSATSNIPYCILQPIWRSAASALRPIWKK